MWASHGCRYLQLDKLHIIQRFSDVEQLQRGGVHGDWLSQMSNIQ